MSEINTYLYRIQPVRPEMLSEGSTPEEDDLVSQHFAYLQDLTVRGVVLLAGRTLTTDSGSFGIIVFQAEDDQAARAIMHADPAVRGRIFRAELFPFRIALQSGA
jgi:uncharacterized protein YciI